MTKGMKTLFPEQRIWMLWENETQIYQDLGEKKVA